MTQKVKLSEELVIQKYKELNNLRKVGEYFNVSYGPIKRILKENNVNIKQRKYEINHDYFKLIDTEEKAYWLGFIYADGYIRIRSSGNSFGIKLSILDVSHLKLLKKSIKSEHKIREGISTTKGKNNKVYKSKMVSFSVHGNEFTNNLIKQGVLPNKTFILQPPNIDEKLHRHFIRGYFDGDGCCYIKKSDRRISSYSIASASKDFTKWLTTILNKNNIKVSGYENEIKLIINTNKSKYNFYHYIYDNANIYLKRKKDKGDIFISYYNKRKDEGMYCFQDHYEDINNVWTEEEKNIILSHINIIPLSYLSGTLLPNKSKKQIHRFCKKHNIRNDKKLTFVDWNKYVDENKVLKLTKRTLNLRPSETL